MKYVSQNRTWDQSEVDRVARRIAAGFAELGVGDGDAVALLLVNELEVIACNVALSLLGAYSVPIGWHSTAAEVAYIVKDSDAKALVAHDLLAGTAATAIDRSFPLIVVHVPEATATAMRLPVPEHDLGRPAIDWAQWVEEGPTWDGLGKPPRPAIVYTSGTTGKPKGVVREPHADEQARAIHARNQANVWGAEPNMRVLLTAPLYHSAPAAYVRSAITNGGEDGEIHFLPRFDAETALAIIAASRISHMWMVPTMFVKLLQLPREIRERYDVSSIRHIVHSGAPCPVGVKTNMIDWLGPVINEFYGSTEVGPVTYATSQDYLSHPGTVGKVLEGCTIAIIGDDGKPADVGVVGEIAAANSTYASFTYHRRQSERDELDANGLVLTGDIGLIDANGYLFLKDRKKDLVISGGVNLYPAEVEDVLLQLANIRDGAAFGVPDDVFGESLVAAVALLEPEQDAETRILEQLRLRLSSTKVPRRIVIVEDFPRSDAGKVSKNKLRSMFA